MSKNTNKTIKLLLIKKVINTNKNKFNSFITKMNLVVKGEEEKGTQEKWVQVKFRKDVQQPQASCIMVCKASDVDAPTKYQVFEKDGEKTYPCVWVRGYEVCNPLKRKASQDAFIVDEEDDEEVEVEDGE